MLSSPDNTLSKEAASSSSSKQKNLFDSYSGFKEYIYRILHLGDGCIFEDDEGNFHEWFHVQGVKKNSFFVLRERIGHDRFGIVFKAINAETLGSSMVRVHLGDSEQQIKSERDEFKAQGIFEGTAKRKTGEEVTVISEFPGHKFLNIMPEDDRKKLLSSLHSGYIIHKVGQVFYYNGHRMVYIEASEARHKLFVLGSCIGAGGQGEVYLAQDIDTKQWIAIKKHNMNTMVADEDIKQERANLDRMNQFLGVAKDKCGNELTLMRYFPGDNLLDCLYNVRKHNEDGERIPNEAPCYYYDRKMVVFSKRVEYIVSGLGALLSIFEGEFVHRDVKTENFIASKHNYSNRNNLVLVDMGSAYCWTRKPQKLCMPSKGYVAPEMTLPIAVRPYYTERQDIFSFCVVAAEILSLQNYQKSIREFVQNLKNEESFNREMDLDEIKDALSDIFSVGFVQDQMYGEDISSSGQALVSCIQKFIIDGLNIDFNARPIGEVLKKAYKEISILYTKYTFEERYRQKISIDNFDIKISKEPARRRAYSHRSGLPSPVGGRERGFYIASAASSAASSTAAKSVSFTAETAIEEKRHSPRPASMTSPPRRRSHALVSRASTNAEGKPSDISVIQKKFKRL